MGQQVETPITPQEKVTAIHSPAQDEEVAAAVTTDLLKRPQVAAKHSETLITWAAIILMTRRLARKGATPSWPRKPAPADG